ncbi:MAG TPA: glycosyltransferase family 39 protein, partial [Bryobacteraceae bacterium]|nr:glycosyltransferase family 39 protein [Bryobacteraceae bacterium]
LPAWVSFQHGWPFDFRHLSWAVTPLGADWCYTAVYLLGGEFAARLLNFALLAVLAALVYAGARRLVAPGLALLAAGLFASTPLVQLVTGSLFVENLWAALLVGVLLALDRFHASGEPRWIYAAAVLIGAALATKFGSLAFAIPAGAVAACLLVAHRKTVPAARVAAGAVLLTLLFGAPQYIYAYVKTGNPVFPFLNHLFGSQWFDASKNLADTRYQTRLGLSTPYDLVFHTRQYLEAHDGALGFQYLLLAPLALLSFSRRVPLLGKLAFFLAAAFALLTYSGVSYVRYLYPALPLVAIAGAAALGRLSSDRALFGATVAALAAAFALNLYFLPSSSWYHPDFFLNPFDRSEIERHYREAAPVRKLVEYMNRQHPGAAVAFFDTGHIAELRAPAYVMEWQNAVYSKRAWLITRPAVYGRYADSLGIRYFIAPAQLSNRELYVIRAFLSRYTDREFSFGAYEVRRLKADAREQWSRENEETVIAACDAGMIDDTSQRVRYSGPWQHWSNFGNACGGSLAFTGAAGAEVSLDFTGTSVTYVFTKAFTRGIAEVFIDGASRGLLDQFSLGIEWRSRAVYNGLGPGRHTLKVRVLHRRAADSLGDDIDVDGFIAAR